MNIINVIRIYAYDVDETALTTFWKTGKVMWRNGNVQIGQFEMRRDEPLQQLSDVSALLTAVRLLWWHTERQEHVKN
jgi:hypothetical protein